MRQLLTFFVTAKYVYTLSAKHRIITMNNPATSISLNGLARRLVADNLLESEIAAKTMAQAKKDGVPFVEMLVAKDILDARTIARVASEEFGSPVFDLTALNKESV